MLRIILLLALAGLGVAYYLHQNKSSTPVVSTVKEESGQVQVDTTSPVSNGEATNVVKNSTASNSTVFAERRAGLAGKAVPQGFKVGLRHYEDVVINTIDGAFVAFKHKDGIARLRIADIENDQMKEFIGWTKEESDEIEAGLAGAQASPDTPPSATTVSSGPASSVPQASSSPTGSKEARNKKYQELQGQANQLRSRLDALLREKTDLEIVVMKSNIKNSRTTQSMRLDQVTREIAAIQSQLNAIRIQIGSL